MGNETYDEAKATYAKVRRYREQRDGLDTKVLLIQLRKRDPARTVLDAIQESPEENTLKQEVADIRLLIEFHCQSLERLVDKGLLTTEELTKAIKEVDQDFENFGEEI